VVWARLSSTPMGGGGGGGGVERGGACPIPRGQLGQAVSSGEHLEPGTGEPSLSRAQLQKYTFKPVQFFLLRATPQDQGCLGPLTKMICHWIARHVVVC
jgi:hypothetical protein